MRMRSNLYYLLGIMQIGIKQKIGTEIFDTDFLKKAICF